MSGGAYTAAEAAALSGVPVTTLRYWVKTGLIEPSVSMARPVLFDFLDLRDLRVIDRLRRQETPTQAIRRAINWLRDEADVQHIVQATLYASGGEVVWVPGDEPSSRVLASAGGQTVLLFTLQDIWSDLGAEIQDGEVVALRPVDGVTIDPTVRGGTPVVEGTRVPTALVAQMVTEGMTPDEIVELYPTLTTGNVEAAANWENRRRTAA
jgi:uncharacterized protein (DUF433 family)/DNA-binding transcriptional MerR regulator